MAIALAAKLLICGLVLRSATLITGLQLDELDESSEYGTVVELTDTTIEAALNKYDHILVDFYAPWCKHCQSLSPELDKAAPMLADGRPPIMVAKINADKYRSAASKYDISVFPTLKFFANGYPTDYDGPHRADSLVIHVRRLTAPAIVAYSSEEQFRDFLKAHRSELPVFVGFGLEASTLEKLAHKCRNRGWFAVLGEYSEKVSRDFKFDKKPALVVLLGEHEVQDVFAGPFEGPHLTNFVKRNLLAAVTPLTIDSLKFLTEDGRPIVVTVLDSDTTAEAALFIKKMKVAAKAHRDFVFASVVASQWPKFVRPFNLGKKPLLPTLIIWDKQHYSKSDKAGAFIGDSMEAELARLLQGYRDNEVKREKLKGPTLYEKATENYTSMIQALILLVALFFTWFRKNKEQMSALQHEAPAGGQSGSRESDASSAVADPSVEPNKED